MVKDKWKTKRMKKNRLKDEKEGRKFDWHLKNANEKSYHIEKYLQTLKGSWSLYPENI